MNESRKKRKLWGTFWYGMFLKDDLGSVGWHNSKALTQSVLATCIICVISMCVFCPKSLQGILFSNNYFFRLRLSTILEGGVHGFSFPSVRSAGLEQQDMFPTCWVSPCWPPRVPTTLAQQWHQTRSHRSPVTWCCKCLGVSWAVGTLDPTEKLPLHVRRMKEPPLYVFHWKEQRSFIHIMVSAEL